jgi:fructokinase
MSPVSAQHQVVCFGEILWDILPDKTLPGGAPMNVAFHLKKLGLQPALITRVGADTYGRKLSTMLANNDLSTDYVQVDDQHETGLVNAKVGANNEVSYDIVYPSAWDFIEWDDRFGELLLNAAYFVFGSLASRNKTSRHTLMRLLETTATKVLDINLRAPHYDQSLVETLLQKADIVKLNEAELQHISAWYGAPEQREEQIRLLQQHFYLDTVIVTRGGEGAMVAHDNRFYYNSGYSVQVADTIGSGDAFLAGFLHQLYNQAPVQQALDFASALGALIATLPGACPAYDTAQIGQLMMANAQSSI